MFLGIGLSIGSRISSGSASGPTSMFGDNGTFDTDTAGWSSARSGFISHVTTDGGRMRVQTTGAAQYGTAVRGFDTVVGHVYRVSGALKATSGAFGYMSLSTGATSFDSGEIKRIFESSSPTTGTYYFIGDGTTLYVHCFAGIANGNWAEFDDVQVTDFGFNLISAGNYGQFNTDIDGWSTTRATAVLSESASTGIRVTQVGGGGIGLATAEFDTVIGNTYYCSGRTTGLNAGSYLVISSSPTSHIPTLVYVANGVVTNDIWSATFVATETKSYFHVASGPNNGNLVIADDIFVADLSAV